MNDAAMRNDIGSLERVARLPSLRDFGVPLATLDEPDAQDISVSVDRVAHQLGKVDDPLSLHLDISDAGSWRLSAGPSGCTVSEATQGPSSVEIILDAETWRRLVTGGMSALEAFGRGRMRVRGDLEDLRRFARLLHRGDSSRSTGS